LVGTGNMAQSHADAYKNIKDVNIVAGVDTNTAQLREFCKKNNINQQFHSVEDAVVWGNFDAASIVTPDGVHHSTAMPLIAAAKHVLCEKPLATNYAYASDMAIKATEKGIVHGVNLTYREGSALQHAAMALAFVH